MTSAFADAIRAQDLDAVEAMLADDVVFRSPVAFRPYAGKPITIAILRAVVEVFDNFRYVRILDADPSSQALVFEASVDGLDVTGCDFLELDADGRITDFMVMVRPLRAAEALSRRMAERFADIAAAAAAAEAAPGP